jgi:uncharacterized membrane protein YczE
MKLHLKQASTYLLGVVVLAFSVNIMKSSTLGAGAWDTVTINARIFFINRFGFDFITLGMMSFIVNFIVMVIVIAYRRQLKYLFMILPMLLVSIFIDLWNFTVFNDGYAQDLNIQILFYVIGIILLPLGLSLIVKSGYPSFVFDELMLLIKDRLNARNITKIRWGIETVGVLIGVFFGYFGIYYIDQTLGSVNLGTLILAFTLSPTMAFYYKLLKIKR